jgi:hypothetical protein
LEEKEEQKLWIPICFVGWLGEEEKGVPLLASDEREIGCPNVKLKWKILNLMKGIIVISHKQWGGGGSPLPPPSSATYII